MLTCLREHDQIDWSRASIDGSSVPSPRRARKRGLNLTIHETLLKLAAAIICARFVDRWC